MSDSLIHDFVQSSDGSTTLTTVSAPWTLGPLRQDSNYNVSITIYDATAFEGTIQGVIASVAADYADASTKWADIDGGDLVNWTGGGATKLTCRYTHIRVKPTSGTGKVRAMR